MLVADALDTVRAEPELVEGRALERLGGDDLDAGVLRAEEVARGDRAGGAGRADERGQPAVRRGVVLPVDLLDHAAGHLVVPDRVAELLELVEDDDAVPAQAPELPALVVDLLDVRLGAGGGDDLVGADLLEPVEPLAAHALGQDRDRGAGEQGAVVSAAAAVVSGRGPDGLLLGRVEVAGDEARDEAAVRRADLVRARREPLADEADDLRLDARERRRELDPVAAAEPAAGRPRLVPPGDPEEVEGVQVPKPDALELLDDLRRDLRGVLLLGELREDDPALAGPLDGLGQHVLVDGPDDLAHRRCLLRRAAARFRVRPARGSVNIGGSGGVAVAAGLPASPERLRAGGRPAGYAATTAPSPPS